MYMKKIKIMMDRNLKLNQKLFDGENNFEEYCKAIDKS